MAVRIEKEDSVWTIIHSRPEARGAMDPASAEALFNAFLQFDADESACVAVFWGEGGSFCAGWDLKHASSLTEETALAAYEFPAVPEQESVVRDSQKESSPPIPLPPRTHTPPPSLAAMGPSRLNLSKPVIAAIAGPAVAGGMELALWADIRVMEETAFMGVYCRRWGIPLIDGGTVRLPRMIGEGRAMDLILTGRRVDADEALRIGLCEYTVASGQARNKAEALARQIASFPQSCMRADRHSARTQNGMSEHHALQQEWNLGKKEIATGIKGALRFATGEGRSGEGI